MSPSQLRPTPEHACKNNLELIVTDVEHMVLGLDVTSRYSSTSNYPIKHTFQYTMTIHLTYIFQTHYRYSIVTN